jgi:hypothetical protein
MGRIEMWNHRVPHIIVPPNEDLSYVWLTELCIHVVYIQVPALYL